MKPTPSISPSYSPNKNTSMINRECSNNLTAHSKNNMDKANAHTSKTNVAITRIDTMVDMTNFSSLCINCNTIILAIVDSTGPQPPLLPNSTQVC